jgi:hypothetical protein
MLVRFTVGNFLSFDTNQSLSLLADAHLGVGERIFPVDSVHLLKFGAIFGANAAGKSNLIKAMAFAHSLVKQGTEAIRNPEVYCRLKAENKYKPSYFEFEIALGDCLYAYGFEVIIAGGVITEEWLVRLSKKEEQTLFARNTQEKTFAYDTSLFDEHIGSRLEAIKEMEHTLLLQATPFPDLLGEVQNWFDHLTLANPSSSLTGYSAFPIEDWVSVSNAIAHFSTGISEITFAHVDEKDVSNQILPAYRKQYQADKEKAGRGNVPYRLQIGSHLFLMEQEGEALQFSEVAFAHKGTCFSYDEESDGTRRLLDLLSVLVTSEQGSVTVIDEIDRSLHPKLTLQFVKNYLELAKTKNIQLVVTTHESLLLNLRLLRRDEIFFVEKDKEGASVIYPFDQFQEQFDAQLEQAYLNGRYGGVPFFESLYLPGEDEE